MSLQHAKSLRTQLTDAERRLWYHLRAHRFHGFKFKRQAPIGPFIVDFACFDHRLIIEVDGGQHANNTSDIQRTAWLESQGFRVLRFWNNDVIGNLAGVLEIVLVELSQSSLNPSPGALCAPPSPTRGEGKESK